jgi:UDP-glucose 4-epimerase
MADRVLVTGGAGFIGSHLAVALLREGFEVRVLDDLSTGHLRNLESVRSELELVQADVCDTESLARALRGVRFVFHEAAMVSVPQSVEQPRRCHEVNGTATAELFELARTAGVERVMFAASAAAYGSEPTLPKSESMAPMPLSPYASTKLYGEHLCGVYTRAMGLPAVPLRYFNIYGPRQDPSGAYAAVISKFQQRMMTGQRPVIFGDGQQTRDFCSVHDVVRANLLAMHAPVSACGAPINIGTGRRTSLLDLVDVFNTISGQSLEPEFRESRAGDIAHSVADVSCAQRMLGYEPGVGLLDGLRELVESEVAHG